MSISGVVLYRGKSQLDGKPIICVATGLGNNVSENTKTGDEIQTWIMRAEMPPIESARLGYNYSVCGDCKHRHIGTCYVNLGQAPLNIYRSNCMNNYVDFNYDKHIHLFKDKMIRVGSYGEPVAVPINIWEMLLKVTKGNTGYTHQWKWRKCNPKYRQFLMASVDTIKDYHKEYFQAKAKGWRTFRVAEPTDTAIYPDEIKCMASEEHKAEFGNALTCETCGLCSGLNGGKKDIVIRFHTFGVMDYRLKRYLDGMKKIKNKKAWKIDFKARVAQFKKLFKI